MIKAKIFHRFSNGFQQSGVSVDCCCGSSSSSSSSSAISSSSEQPICCCPYMESGHPDISVSLTFTGCSSGGCYDGSDTATLTWASRGYPGPFETCDIYDYWDAYSDGESFSYVAIGCCPSDESGACSWFCYAEWCSIVEDDIISTTMNCTKTSWNATFLLMDRSGSGCNVNITASAGGT